jgi:hypothetical protein
MIIQNSLIVVKWSLGCRNTDSMWLALHIKSAGLRIDEFRGNYGYKGMGTHGISFHGIKQHTIVIFKAAFTWQRY